MSEVKAKATLDSNNFNAGLGKMKGGVQGLAGGFSKLKGGVVGIIAAMTTGAIAKGIGSIIQFGSEMTDMAVQTGISIETLQRYQKAVRMAGGENQHLVNALSRVRDSQGEVITGDKTLTEAYNQLGISAQEVASLDVEGLFMRISQAMTESGNSATAFSAVSDIIGQRNAPKLLEAMNMAAEGVGMFGDKVAILSDESAKRLDYLSDRMGEFKNSIKVHMAEALVSTIDFFTGSKQAEESSQGATKRRTEELAKQARLAKLAKTEAEKANPNSALKSSSASSIISDSISSIGGMSGASSGALTLAQQQLSVQERQEDLLKNLPAIKANTATSGGLA